jgi:folate-dependent tRNA-U54 methylase TrmFO/GidA
MKNEFNITVKKMTDGNKWKLISTTGETYFEACIKTFKEIALPYMEAIKHGYNEPVSITASEGRQIIAIFQLR